MIVHITGILKNKNIDEIIIEANGLGYLCHISNNTLNRLPSVGENIKILTFLHITENKHTLYGFYDIEERKLFKMLISVSGIGPKIGIQLLSNTNSDQFSNMIINSDVKMLSSLPEKMEFVDEKHQLTEDSVDEEEVRKWEGIEEDWEDFNKDKDK